MTWGEHHCQNIFFRSLGPAQRVVDGETIFGAGAQLCVPRDRHRHNKLCLSEDENHDDNNEVGGEANLNVLQAVMICFEATLAMLPARPATLSLLLMLTTQKSVKWMTRTTIIVIIRTAQLVKA